MTLVFVSVYKIKLNVSYGSSISLKMFFLIKGRDVKYCISINDPVLLRETLFLPELNLKLCSGLIIQLYLMFPWYFLRSKFPACTEES